MDDAKFGTDSIVVAHSFGGYMRKGGNKALIDLALVMVDSGFDIPTIPYQNKFG